MSEVRFVLGSASPRRKELLAGMEIDFEVRTKNTDEIFPDTLLPKEVPAYLATLKAKALLDDLQEKEVLICADTVVILNDKIIGKPLNTQEAIQMLSDLSGKTHEVVTGVFIGNTKKQLVRSDSTLVTFEQLFRKEMEFYVNRYSPFDKAGSYGVQEWLGYIAVKRIVGSYTNVMGLPTNLVYRMMNDFT